MRRSQGIGREHLLKGEKSFYPPHTSFPCLQKRTAIVTSLYNGDVEAQGGEMTRPRPCHLAASRPMVCRALASTLSHVDPCGAPWGAVDVNYLAVAQGGRSRFLRQSVPQPQGQKSGNRPSQGLRSPPPPAEPPTPRAPPALTQGPRLEPEAAGLLVSPQAYELPDKPQCADR